MEQLAKRRAKGVDTGAAIRDMTAALRILTLEKFDIAEGECATAPTFAAVLTHDGSAAASASFSGSIFACDSRLDGAAGRHTRGRTVVKRMTWQSRVGMLDVVSRTKFFTVALRRVEIYSTIYLGPGTRYHNAFVIDARPPVS